MLTKSIALFSLICKISNSFGSILVTWNNDLRVLVLNEDDSDDVEAFRRKQQRLRNKNYLHSFAVFIVILQCLLGRDNSIFIKAQEIIAIGILQCLTTHLHVCRLKEQEFLLYFNGHFQFHDFYNHLNYGKEKSKSKMTLTELLNKLFAQIFAVTGLTFPTAVFGVHWMDPCRASLPGYWLLNECSRGTKCYDQDVMGYILFFKGILTKSIVFLFSQWIWQFGVNASVFVNSGLTALGTMEIRSHIQTYLNLYQSDGLSLYQKIIAFRRIQVLMTLANDISQGSALPSLIFAAICGISAGLAMLIRISWTSDNILLIFIFVCCTVNGFMILGVCLSGMVSVYMKSKELQSVAKWRQFYHLNKNRFEGKTLEKFWRSCALMKIKFGSSNYAEELTPLNSLNFSINLTVQFLLVKG